MQVFLKSVPSMVRKSHETISVLHETKNIPMLKVKYVYFIFKQLKIPWLPCLYLGVVMNNFRCKINSS